MFALSGVDWRSWSAADRAAVGYLLLRRQHADDVTALRELYELADDTEGLAALARQNLGQGHTIETTR